MSEYIFENKDKTELKDCSGDQMKAIADGVESGTTDFLHGCDWKRKKDWNFHLKAIYRVRNPQPTPNQIDWAQFPDWVVACVTDHDRQTYIWSSKELGFDGADWGCNALLFTGSKLKMYNITDFPGFKRGTVAPKDSLLIKPQGK